MKSAIVDAATAIPATGKLLYRLVRDERVDQRRRIAVVAALAYAVLPFDFIPDRLPLIGKMDDVLLGAAAVQALFEAAGPEIVEEHWDGSPRALEALLSGLDVASGLIPRPIRRLVRFGG